MKIPDTLKPLLIAGGIVVGCFVMAAVVATIAAPYLEKRRGCLVGKTQEQKDAFFESLADFYLTDPVFFEEQVDDLQAWEQREFLAWAQRRNKVYRAILGLCDTIEKLSHGKDKRNTVQGVDIKEEEHTGPEAGNQGLAIDRG